MSVLAAGSVIDGRFRLIEEVGRGGMGVVYRAEHIGMEKPVALKVLSAGAAADKRTVDRFQREAHVISLLDHPNIVKIYAVGVLETGMPYIAMEFLDGEQLSAHIARQGRLEWRHAVRVFKQICDGLEHAHEKQIVHRDIKPSNIVLLGDPISGDEVVKIVDFGIAKYTADGAPKLTQTDAIIGSLFYASPQQLSGQQPTPASDIYSLGCTLFEALTGTPPFSGDTVFATMNAHLTEDAPSAASNCPSADIPESLDALVRWMMEKDAESRPNSANEVRQSLDVIEQGKTIQIKSRSPRTRRTSSVPSTTKLVLTTVAMSVACATIYFVGGFATPKRIHVKLDPHVRMMTEGSRQPQERLLTENVIRAIRSGTDNVIQQSLQELGGFYMDSEKHQAALRILNKALAMAQTPSQRARAMSALAGARFSLGLDVEAIEMYKESIALQQKEQQHVLDDYVNLAKRYREFGNYEEAEKLLRTELIPYRDQWPPPKPAEIATEAFLVYTALGNDAEVAKAEAFLNSRQAGMANTHFTDFVKLHSLSYKDPRAAYSRLEKAIKVQQERAVEYVPKRENWTHINARWALRILFNDIWRISSPRQRTLLKPKIDDNESKIKEIAKELQNEDEVVFAPEIEKLLNSASH